MKFKNEVYSDLVNDLILDAFYIDRPNRGKIASIRQYAEVVVRKILDLSENDKVTLGDKKIVKKLEEISENNRFLMSSVKKIQLAGNKCIHTQETRPITEQDILNCIDSLFNMYASLFVLYFNKYKFGSNNKIMSVFSILPPIIRYLVLNELYKQNSDNLSVIDKLSLVLLKAFDKDQAVSWIEAEKEKLSQILPYTDETIEHIKNTKGEFVAQRVINDAPASMYVVCIGHIYKVEKIIKSKGLLYNNFEQAKQLYLNEGVLEGNDDDILEFNSIMEFVYLGRKVEENPSLENIDSYIVIN
ncbi:hypothetical protein [Xenorhabdus bovienii]|uniref:hypothetical protein n=1 Tax=Xenorhabdus bovienii TaxID=40576 RepID=UPI0004D578A7|nr:hypothetical protein [Xenorhabdus bovienii]CDG89333.1 conserved hypothetical protein [Xenorhabdus bovienii str. feltiae France]CDG91343.1 conserved hypothetical protein [Xenorhabdus bovienii str. feltiae Florida]